MRAESKLRAVKDSKGRFKDIKKGRAQLDTLDPKKGGIPDTKRNKNREAFLAVNRELYASRDDVDFDMWLDDAIVDLINDKIDTITITVKKRTW